MTGKLKIKTVTAKFKENNKEYYKVIFEGTFTKTEVVELFRNKGNVRSIIQDHKEGNKTYYKVILTNYLTRSKVSKLFQKRGSIKVNE